MKHRYTVWELSLLEFAAQAENCYVCGYYKWKPSRPNMFDQILWNIHYCVLRHICKVLLSDCHQNIRCVSFPVVNMPEIHYATCFLSSGIEPQSHHHSKKFYVSGESSWNCTQVRRANCPFESSIRWFWHMRVLWTFKLLP